jgi:hypothetical protein
MDDQVTPGHRFLNRFGIANIAFDELVARMIYYFG